MWIKACILLISVLALACKPVSNVASCSIKETVEKTLVTPIIEFNFNKDFALCFESGPNRINGQISYIILISANCSIIEKGTFRPGYIKWISNSKIEMLDLPGALDGDNDLTKFKKTISIKTNN
jgi:hypothetical protein